MARSLVTEKGRETPVLGLDPREQQWERCRHDVQARAGTRFVAAGVYNGYRKEPPYCKLYIERLYFGYERLELFCGTDAKTERFLDGLKKGDELLFQFSAAGDHRASLGALT